MAAIDGGMGAGEHEAEAAIGNVGVTGRGGEAFGFDFELVGGSLILVAAARCR